MKEINPRKQTLFCKHALILGQDKRTSPAWRGSTRYSGASRPRCKQKR
jgi:hypothetical protein